MKLCAVLVLLLLYTTSAINVALIPAPRRSSISIFSKVTTYLNLRGHQSTIYVFPKQQSYCRKSAASSSCSLLREDVETPKQLEFEDTREMIDINGKLLRALTTLFEEAQPNYDVFLVDHRMFAADLVAEVLDAPTVFLSLTAFARTGVESGLLTAKLGKSVQKYQHFMDGARSALNLTTAKFSKFLSQSQIITPTIPGFDYSSPIYPNHRPIGFVFPEPRSLDPKYLASAFGKWLDGCRRGVVLVDLHDGLPPGKVVQIRDALTRVSSENICVLWKTHSLQLETEESQTFKVVNTLPFSLDVILRHNNTKMILSRCGRTTMYEAIEGESVIIGIPQTKSERETCSQVVKKQVGVSMKLDEINDEFLYTQILEALHNFNLQENIRRIKRMGYIMGGAQRATDIIELSARLGRNHNYDFVGEHPETFPFFENADILLLFSFFTALTLFLLVAVTRKCRTSKLKED